jgi:hypothetical protein
VKIAIVGAGWMGCHQAMKLKDKHEVQIYEAFGIFEETSYRNQNRLHLGYHYARNGKTRDMCRETFNRFIEDYPFLVDEIDKNIYVVPKEDSIVDFITYKKIFDEYEYSPTQLNCLSNIQGAISVQEKYINPFKASQYFKEQLSEIIHYENISPSRLGELSEDNDLVINCTNNSLSAQQLNTYSEMCEVLVYEKTMDVEFGALTFVDGELFSIFPYLNDLYTVTHVKYTPNSDMTTEDKQKKIEEAVSKYYPDFLDDFKFSGSFLSKKIKVVDKSDPRVPVIHLEGKILNCFTGKIQGIYVVQDFVEELCESL